MWLKNSVKKKPVYSWNSFSVNVQVCVTWLLASQTSSVVLFSFPREDKVKVLWLAFIQIYADGENSITTKACLCSNHFTSESFSNFAAGAYGLQLIQGALPSSSLLALDRPAPTMSAATAAGAASATGATRPPASVSKLFLAPTKTEPSSLSYARWF